MQAYENGGHAYQATMPTDALMGFRDAILQTKAYGLEKIRQQQMELGTGVRALLANYQFKSVAAPGFEEPGVVVVYTDDDGLHNFSKFKALGLQIAAGIPLQCDEPADFKTFRIGLLGLDKLYDPQATIDKLDGVLKQLV